MSAAIRATAHPYSAHSALICGKSMVRSEPPLLLRSRTRVSTKALWGCTPTEFFCHKTFSGRENRYAAKQLERASSEGPMLSHFCSFDICRAAAKRKAEL